MITTINIGNKDNYKKLFAEATEKLRKLGLLEEKFVEVTVAQDEFQADSYYVKNGEEYVLAQNWGADEQYYVIENGIETLEEYFCNIDSLLGSLDGDEAEDYDPKYIMLPLDEEPFEIDANARTITVPAAFRKNGVGVQGDEIAEMLYFTIDRYFDAVDFDTADIYVQWEAPSGEQYVTQICAAGEEGGLKELTRYPGKILFAWPLTSKATAKSGNLKFSVRIIKKDEALNNPIVYSFSTLTASVAVNPGQNFDLSADGGVKVDNYYTLFQSAITNSQNTTGVDADMPKFFYDALGDNYIYLEDEQGTGATWTTSLMKVGARVEDAGTITYKWYFQKDKETPRKFLGYEGKGVNPIWTPEKYMASLTESYLSDYYKAYNEKISYFAKTGLEIYEPYVYVDEATFQTDRDNLFLRLSRLTISASVPANGGDSYEQVAGYYYCIAVNRLNNREKSNTSSSAFLPSAEKLEFTTNLGEKRAENGDLVTDEDACAYEQDYIDESFAAAVDVEADDHAALSYVWKKADTIDGEYAIVEGSAAKLNITEDGFYKVCVDSVVNMTVLQEETKSMKLTHAPVAPVIKRVTESDDSTINAANSISIELEENEFDNTLKSEELIYFWSIDVDGELATAEFTVEKSSSKFDRPNVLAASEIAEAITGDTKAGFAVVYCQVKNRIGSKFSEFSNVSDKYLVSI